MIEKLKTLEGRGLDVVAWLCGLPEGERPTQEEVGRAVGLVAPRVVLGRLVAGGWVSREKPRAVGKNQQPYRFAASRQARSWWGFTQAVLGEVARDEP
jgi:hypothetical protein